MTTDSRRVAGSTDVSVKRYSPRIENGLPVMVLAADGDYVPFDQKLEENIAEINAECDRFAKAYADCVIERDAKDAECARLAKELAEAKGKGDVFLATDKLNEIADKFSALRADRDRLAGELAEAKRVVELGVNHENSLFSERDALAAQVARLREALEDTAESLAVALGRLGVCGEGDGADHRADADSWGGTAALAKARDALQAELAEAKALYSRHAIRVTEAQRDHLLALLRDIEAAVVTDKANIYLAYPPWDDLYDRIREAVK